MKKLNNKGFSLVELIIVIAIMVILVAVLAPQFTKYVERSRVSTDVQTASEIATAVQVAAADGTLTTTSGVANPTNLPSLPNEPTVKNKVSGCGNGGTFTYTYNTTTFQVTVTTTTGSKQLFPTVCSELLPYTE